MGKIQFGRTNYCVQSTFVLAKASYKHQSKTAFFQRLPSWSVLMMKGAVKGPLPTEVSAATEHW